MSERETESKQESGATRRGPFRRAVTGVGRVYVRLQFGDMKAFLQEQKAFAGWVTRQLRRRDSDRQESFEAAVRRLGLSEDRLAERLKGLGRSSWVYGLLAALALVFLACSPFVVHARSQFLMSFGLFLLMGSRCVATRFRIAQIRKRRFMGFFEWIKGASDEHTAG